MKKSFLGMAAIFLLLFAACEQKSPDTETKNEAPRKKVALYGLSLDSAKMFVQNYDTTMSKLLKDTLLVKAFTLHAADLLEVLGVSDTINVKYKDARIYLGLDSHNKFRLFLTPVKGADLRKRIAGEDVILSGPYEGSRLGTQLANDGDYVLDFAQPCPTTCPDNSPIP